jgi:hypothetical protein
MTLKGGEPDYEVIGGGVIDDRRPRRAGTETGTATAHDDEPRTHARDLVSAAARAAWSDALASFTSWRYWVACILAIAVAGGLTAALVGFGAANGWFETGLLDAVYLLTGAWLVLVAAVHGAVRGFRRPARGVFSTLFSGLLHGLVLGLLAGIVLAAVCAAVGGPIALAIAAVVVVTVEVALFGLIGAGSRACFRRALPGGILMAVLLAFLLCGNIVATLALLPATSATAEASVPVNVERDESGRMSAYECVGQVRPVEVMHTDRVVWIAASNPVMVFGSTAGEFVPRNSDFGWILSGLQWAADGPQRDVPCLGGESSDSLPPTVPVAFTGLVLQCAVAALVVIPGRLRLSRRARAA